MSLESLQNYIQRNPGLADVPIVIVNGIALSPRQCVFYLKKGEMVQEITSALQAAKIDPPEDEEWKLLEAYYARKSVTPGFPSVISIPPYIINMPISEILKHIRARDEIGRFLLKSQIGLMEEIRKGV